MNIGERIKSIRESKWFSQTELADKINVSKQTLYKYENGIITNIPSDKIEAIGNILNVSPSYLMGWSEINESPDEKQLLDIYKELNPDNKKLVIGYADGKLQEQKKESSPAAQRKAV